MGGVWQTFLWAAVAALLCATLVALARSWRGGRPLVRLATALVVAGCVALGASLLIAALGIATAPTPQFYHGMLTGIGVGALTGALALMLMAPGER